MTYTVINVINVPDRRRKDDKYDMQYYYEEVDKNDKVKDCG